jgi:fermentation-respiration switch protein FrsA (DUF1100 family)
MLVGGRSVSGVGGVRTLTPLNAHLRPGLRPDRERIPTRDGSWMRMRSFLFPLSLVLITSSVVIACGSSDPSGSTTPPASSPPATNAEPPSFHFIVDRNGSKTEVKEIIYTDPFAVRVDGLAAAAEVTLSTHLYTPGAKGRGYTSTATFVADAKGSIDTSTMPSLRGTWEGVDADAIFWSAKEGPLEEGLGPDRRAAFFDVTVGDAVVGQASLTRLAMAANVKVEKVSADTGLVAELFMPEGATDRVPVVAFGGSEGGISGGEGFAMHFASLGHPTLAVAYFGMPGVPEELTEVPLEYFQKAFAYLDTRPETRKQKAIVAGGSRGGELALLLGAVFPNNVVGVIAETPSSYRWAGLGLEKKSAWTFQGKPLAFVPGGKGVSALNPPTVKTPQGQMAYVLRPMFEEAIKDAPADDLEAARIHVEDIGGSVLMLAGSDDQMWPACDFVARAMTRLTASGHVGKHADEGVCFPDAGHAVGMLGLPTVDSMWANLGDTSYALGGTAKGNAHAGRASDEKIRSFLARVTK